MKVSFVHLVVIYLLAFCFCTLYSLTSVNECEAYWMHDASIVISKKRIITDAVLLFLSPALIILARKLFQLKIQGGFFLMHFFIAATSISSFVFAIDKPCEKINNGNYMFISSPLIFGYYLLKLLSLVILCILLIQTIILKNKVGQA